MCRLLGPLRLPPVVVRRGQGGETFVRSCRSPLRFAFEEIAIDSSLASAAIVGGGGDGWHVAAVRSGRRRWSCFVGEAVKYFPRCGRL